MSVWVGPFEEPGGRKFGSPSCSTETEGVRKRSSQRNGSTRLVDFDDAIEQPLPDDATTAFLYSKTSHTSQADR